MTTLEVRRDPTEAGFDPRRLERIRTHFDAYVEDRRLAGWLVTLAREGDLVWTGRGGHRHREQDLPVTDDTIWRIYSMTKPLTTVAALTLYEEGLFDLTDDVGRWIDELREPRVYVGGPPTAPQSVPAVEPVRVHHLLTHMSGLTYGFNYTHPVDAIYRAKGYDFGYPRDADLERAVHDWCTSPLLFQPGSRWNYSVATDVLGRLIELWSGQPLDEFLRERVLDPLGMADTDWFCPEDNQDRLAMLYVPNEGDSLPFADLARGAQHRPGVLGGGGGLVSSAHDYQRFMTMLLRGGVLDDARILSPRTVALMTANHLPGGVDLAAVAMDSFAEVDFAGIGFGLGVSVVTDPRRNKSLVSEGTYGWGGAASTAFWVDPVRAVSVAFYTQLLPSGTYPLRRELQQLVYQAMVD